MSLFDAFGYKGKRVVVVGGATGMGAAVAELVLDAGAETIVLDRADVTLGGVKAMKVDMSDKASIEAATAEIGGPVDALFSCAGVADGTPGIERINFIGHRHMINLMVDSGALKQGSSIGLISSAAGFGWEQNLDQLKEYLAITDFDAASQWAQEHNHADYLWSKLSINAYIALEAMNFLKKGIRINAILPGPTNTPLAQANAEMWLGFGADYREEVGVEASTPLEQAYPLVFLCSDAASVVTGVTLVTDAGYFASGVSGAYASASEAVGFLRSTFSATGAGVDFSLNEDERALVDLCRRFAQEEIATRAPAVWEAAVCPTDLLREMGQLGLLGMLVPEQWGGIGMSTVGFVAAMEEIGRADQSVAAAFQAHVTIGSLPLLLFGNDEQRERWLRPLAEGRALGAFGLTEPDAGSDARGIRTRAERRDGGWLINGRKTFISNAGTDMSFGVTLLARVEDAYGTFVVEKDTPGFTMGPKMRGIGWKGLDTRELFFDDVFVPDEHLVGDPNLGLSQFLRTLEVGRISIAALSLSLTQAVLDLALDYAKQRVQFGQAISKFQAVQFKLADIATELEAARWLTYRAASLRDAGEPFLKEAAMAKLKASRLATWAASEAVQIHGGTGYMLESPVARFYCDAKVLEIGEGTNEIQHLVIARALGC